MIGLIEKNNETSKKKALALEAIESLRKRKAELDVNISKLSTEEGIEASIRDKYQVAKVGEGVITIVDAQPKTEDSTTVKSNPGFWGFLKKILGRAK
jgi:cell division protein FtsB